MTGPIGERVSVPVDPDDARSEAEPFVPAARPFLGGAASTGRFLGATVNGPALCDGSRAHEWVPVGIASFDVGVDREPEPGEFKVHTADIRPYVVRVCRNCPAQRLEPLAGPRP